MKLICQILLLITSFYLSPFIFALGQYTQVNHVQIYSEYYPNPKAHFKGTIVFENGGMNTINEWTKNKKFFHCVQKQGGLFLYDRNGLGKSPPDLSSTLEHPITAKTINEKLIKLLKLRDIPPPYILVAHSYGGLFAGYFARKYPKLVKGVLMVDPTPKNREFPNKVWATINTMKQEAYKLTSKEMYTKYSYKNAKKLKTIPTAVFYHMLGFEQTKYQIKQLPPLSNNIPIILLSSSQMEKLHPIEKGDWYKSQKEWLNSNSNSKIIRVKSNHFIHLQHPMLVCNQLKSLVNLASNKEISSRF